MSKGDRRRALSFETKHWQLDTNKLCQPADEHTHGYGTQQLHSTTAACCQAARSCVPARVADVPGRPGLTSDKSPEYVSNFRRCEHFLSRSPSQVDADADDRRRNNSLFEVIASHRFASLRIISTR